MAATRRTARKSASASRRAPVRKPAGRATPAKSTAAKPMPKPASMSGPLPPIVTLRHLAEWAAYNHDLPRKQAMALFAGFVEDVSRVLKRGSKIRIPDLGILQVRVRPARPARMGRNPATGEAIQIKASRASKRVAFRPAKTLKESV